ncbi:hypothetical protein GALL_243470 [mine drainage metagenome]|uniref:DUF2946 domain-containing protein n=1 Tax=mine drainage metagenome TaxID=410659 RepID=A0A1J5RE84_9ZZZZ
MYRALMRVRTGPRSAPSILTRFRQGRAIAALFTAQLALFNLFGWLLIAPAARADGVLPAVSAAPAAAGGALCGGPPGRLHCAQCLPLANAASGALASSAPPPPRLSRQAGLALAPPRLPGLRPLGWRRPTARGPPRPA